MISFDQAACGLIQTAENGTILEVNRAFCTWIGHSRDTLVDRRRFQQLLTVGGRMFHQTHWSPLLRMQGSLSEVKLEVVHADGTLIPMVFNALRRQDDDGTVVHELAAFVARDRDAYERELIASRERLEALVAESNRHHAAETARAIFAEQMVGIVSHDLRNPLSTITLATALLGRSEISLVQQRTLGRITSATARATRLLTDLLDFTQARLGGGLSIDPRWVDLHEEIAPVVDDLAHLYPSRGLVHERAGDGAVHVDTNRLAQLVGNLVSNAMTYGAPSEAVTVTSTVEAATFRVSVHNRGPVVPEEIRQSLFEPMTRGTKANSAGRSVGLGLFIVREIARAHGGTTEVSSTPELGTRFTAVFPRGKAPDAGVVRGLEH